MSEQVKADGNHSRITLAQIGHRDKWVFKPKHREIRGQILAYYVHACRLESFHLSSRDTQTQERSGCLISGIASCLKWCVRDRPSHIIKYLNSTHIQLIFGITNGSLLSRMYKFGLI